MSRRTSLENNDVEVTTFAKMEQSEIIIEDHAHPSCSFVYCHVCSFGLILTDNGPSVFISLVTQTIVKAQHISSYGNQCL